MRPDIFEAIQSGDYDSFQTALIAEPNPLSLVNRFGSSLFHLAAFYGRDIMLRELLNIPGAKANVDHRNRIFQTPLHQAAKRGNIACVRSLLSEGASVTALNMFGDNALSCAAARK